MTRSSSSTVTDAVGMLAIALLSTSCTFAEGNPWGDLDASLSVTLNQPESRQSPEGWLKTNNGYTVEFKEFNLELIQMEVRLTPPDTGAIGFDPADPPPGYSLCHNGHCHHDSGRLVDYEDIAIELANSVAGGASALMPIEQTITIMSPNVANAVPLGSCDDTNCYLERGNLSSVELTVRSVSVEMVVRDAQSSTSRLPEEGLRVAGEFPLSKPFVSAVSGEVGEETTIDIKLAAQLLLSEKTFDSIDWASFSNEGEPVSLENLEDLKAMMGAQVLEASKFTITTN